MSIGTPGAPKRGLLVGIDVGGTKVAIRAETPGGAVVVDRVLPADGWTVDPAAAAAAWISGRLDEALPAGTAIAGVGVGAQKCHTAERARALVAALADLGLRAQVVNDAILLVYAAGLEEGVTVVAGTGSVAAGRGADGEVLLAGGWGWALGDEGGAPSLVREAVRAALRERDEGRPETVLLAHLLGAFGVADADELVLTITDDPSPAHLGPAAPAVFAAAEEGSTLARRVIAEAADALAELVAVLRRRGARGPAVVAAGGVIHNQPRLFRAFRDAVRRDEPATDVRLLEAPPVAGAMVLARRAAAPVSVISPSL